MTAITNAIASDSNITVWVVPEATPGVLVQPEAENIIAAFDITYPTQVPEYTNSKEKANTRDVLNRCQGQMPAGEWAFSTYCRPDGAGVVPQERNLVYGLAGNETINAAVDVEYAPALDKPSFSIWFLVDHTMLYCKGATIGGATLNLEECSLTWQWSGGFMAMGVTGTDPLVALVAPAATVIEVTDAEKFSIGGAIALTDATGAVVDDNAGFGYVITVVDSINDSIEVGTAAAIGAPVDGFVAPFNPGGTISGNPLPTKKSTVSMNGVDKPVVGFTWVVTDEPEYLDREKTPSGYPESYAETQREVGGEIGILFRRDDADEFKKAIEGTQQPIILTVGDLTGYTVEISMPRCSIDVPTIEEAPPVVELKIPYTALATDGEDSYIVVYK